jgi:CRISPR/Cas system-associated protein endoribonuclease Cas2
MTKGIGKIEASIPGRTKDARKIRKKLMEIYFDQGYYFRQFFTKSVYVKDWYDYVILVRQLGVYW